MTIASSHICFPLAKKAHNEPFGCQRLFFLSLFTQTSVQGLSLLKQGAVVINSNPQNLEAVCLFFDITSSAMKEILNVGRANLNLVSQQIEFYQSYSLAFGRQTLKKRKMH